MSLAHICIVLESEAANPRRSVTVQKNLRDDGSELFHQLFDTLVCSHLEFLSPDELSIIYERSVVLTVVLSPLC